MITGISCILVHLMDDSHNDRWKLESHPPKYGESEHIGISNFRRHQLGYNFSNPTSDQACVIIPPYHQ